MFTPADHHFKFSMLYKYFLLVHILICEFLKYIKKFFLEITNKINSILDDHPEYVLHIYGTPFVVVYLDTGENMNGFDPRSDILRDIDSKINFAEEKLKKYEQSNGHLFFLRINYCLENRFPVTGIIDDDMLPQNLEEVCLKIGTGIYHLSFDTYYVCRNDSIYIYDSDVAKLIEQLLILWPALW